MAQLLAHRRARSGTKSYCDLARRGTLSLQNSFKTSDGGFRINSPMLRAAAACCHRVRVDSFQGVVCEIGACIETARETTRGRRAHHAPLSDGTEVKLVRQHVRSLPTSGGIARSINKWPSVFRVKHDAKPLLVPPRCYHARAGHRIGVRAYQERTRCA